MSKMSDKNPTPLFVRIIMYPYLCWYEWNDNRKSRKEWLKNNVNKTPTDALGHNHEWEEHKDEGWVYCWICKEEKEINQKN